MEKAKEIYKEMITEPFAENWRKLGEYLQKEQKEGKTEFRIAFQNDRNFIIHPIGKDGNTIDMSLDIIKCSECGRIGGKHWDSCSEHW